MEAAKRAPAVAERRVQGHHVRRQVLVTIMAERGAARDVAWHLKHFRSHAPDRSVRRANRRCHGRM